MIKNIGKPAGKAYDFRVNKALYVTVGWLLIAMALFMSFPLAVSFFYSGYNDLSGMNEIESFIISQIFCLSSGVALLRGFKGKSVTNITIFDGFLIAASGWVVIGIFGALPFIISGAMPDILDAIFESISGFTTTGASVISDLNRVPRGIMFWRNMEQWLGGMGIITLFVAVIPAMAEGSQNLFRAEIPGGANFKKITPRIRNTAKILWTIYLLLTATETILLVACGLPLYDAICFSFTTLSTGGFCIYPGSAGDIESMAVQWVLIIFMFIAGASTSLHYYAFKDKSLKPYKSDPEYKVYVLLLLICGLMLSWTVIWMEPVDEGLLYGITHGFFQAVSILTTTGYSSVDFDLWNPFAKSILLGLMFVGGCSGSTAGSIKIIRFIYLYKGIRADSYQTMHPREVVVARVGGEVIAEELLKNTFVFATIYVLIFLAGGAALTICGQDMISAFSASIACLGNIGPGLGNVGPSLGYGDILAPGKIVLIVEMIMGRLELFGVLILIYSFSKLMGGWLASVKEMKK